MITVIIADDHTSIREGISAALSLEAGVQVVGQAGDGQGAINLARRLKPDVVLMDINMPVTDGILATQIIKRELFDSRVIALTVYEDERVVEILSAGADAYVLKDAAPEELMAAIRKVAEGREKGTARLRAAPGTAKEAPREGRQEDVHLTRREKDILELLVKGNSNKEIAGILIISEKTAKNHLTNIFRKLAVKDRTQAAVYALKNGLIRYDQIV